MSRREVITGMGAITPLGTGVEKFWEGIKANKVCISEIDINATRCPHCTSVLEKANN